MSTPTAPIHKHITTAKEHLAGIKAARVWHQELAAAGLLRSQSPIHEQPPQDQEGEQT